MMLKNKVAVVTGARQGIGLGIALALAKEGCNVVVSDLEDCETALEQVKKEGVLGLAIKCDVSKKQEVESLFEQAKKEFGKVDILINNAGIFPFIAFDKMTESDWDKVIDVNLKSIFLCSKEALNIMPDGGRIINISSIAGFVGFEGLTHYCASKGAINSFVRALALEVASKKITVNAVAPGAIETPGASMGSDEQKQQTIKAIPLNRMGQPQDIANAVVFLASNNADYITGQTIIVDGGWTLR